MTTAFPDASPHPVLVCRGLQRLTYVNLAAEQLVAELDLESAIQLLPTDHLQIKQACLASSQSTCTETTVRDRVITWSYHPIGGESAVYLFGVDVTEHKRSLKPVYSNTLQMAALNQMATGVVAVDKSLKVLFTNKAADRLLSSDGLSVQDGHLVGYMQPITEKIRQMVADVFQGGETHAAISIPRPSRSFIEILVSLGDENSSAPAAIVFLYDPDAPRGPITGILMSLYGLTPAEARLVESLVGGRSLTAAAYALDISKETVRNQIQSVYKKTATHQQAELLRHVQAGPAGALQRTNLDYSG